MIREEPGVSNQGAPAGEEPGARTPSGGSAEPASPGHAHESRVKPLTWLRREIAGYALPATLVPDMPRPHVAVHLRGGSDLTVTVERRDGRLAYVWGPIETTHPLADPTGCARRIATMLRRERGL